MVCNENFREREFGVLWNLSKGDEDMYFFYFKLSERESF